MTTPMTYAESIRKRIERQSSELQRLLDGIDNETATMAMRGEWSPNELLLHLIGDTADIAAGLRRALSEENPRITREQPGGKYLNTGDGSKDELLTKLSRQLGEISDAVHDLDDEALSRTVTIAGEAIDTSPRVPVGLWIRDAVGDHFDPHMDQLRTAIAWAARAHGARE